MGSSSTLPSTSALEGGGWSAPRAGRFTPGKDPVPIVIGGWVGPSVGLDSCRNSRPPPGFDSRTIRPVRVAIPTELSRPTQCYTMRKITQRRGTIKVRSQNCEKRLLASPCTSVCLSSWLPVDGFPRNLISEYLSRLCPGISGFRRAFLQPITFIIRLMHSII